MMIILQNQMRYQYVEYQERVSIKAQIDTVNEEFSENYQNFKELSAQVLEQNQKENEELRDNLKNMIEELVSGATNAGLAKSYEQAKNEHRQEIDKWKEAFTGCIILITLILLIITAVSEFQFSLSGVIQRMMLIASVNFPLIWLAYLSNKNINQNKRLYEEYLHKWSIAFSFDGMKREIKELSQEEKSDSVSQLLEVYLKATELNPSLTLDKVQKTDSPADKLAEIIPMDKLTEIAKEVINIKEKLDNEEK